jgi:hypothetical protein
MNLAPDNLIWRDINSRDNSIQISVTIIQAQRKRERKRERERERKRERGGREKDEKTGEMTRFASELSRIEWNALYRARSALCISRTLYRCIIGSIIRYSMAR